MAATTSPLIDLLDPSSFAHGQPQEQFRWLRDNDPVHRHAEPDGPGFWAITRHRDVKTIGRDPVTFSSEPSTMIADGAALDLGGHQMMLFMDPPRHTGYRHVLSGDFIPRAARALQPRIRELAATIIDGVAQRGQCDLVEDLAGLMPSYVIAEMLGIPHSDGVALYRLTETIHAAPESVPEGAGLGAVIEMFNYAHGVWEDKRARPGNDLATKLISGAVDGVLLDEIDFNLYFLLLIDAGGDTTRNLVAGGMQALFEHPDARQQLGGDLDRLLPGAVEEMLRWVSPVVYMRRTATSDAIVGGQPIAAGDKVVMYYGAANRDPEAFVEPDRFAIDRHPNDHVAFGGGGPHFCLGAHIGRLEIDAMLREILTRLPDMQPDGDTEWLPSTFISGPKHLPVRFTPA
jgi:cytochrome P450